MIIKTQYILDKISQIEEFALKSYINIKIEYRHYKDNRAFPFVIFVMQNGSVLTTLQAENKRDLYNQLVGFGAGLARYRLFQQR